jgi:hypothetical protein
MASEKDLIKLEREIYSKMKQIQSRQLLPKDSGIGKMINLMKTFDEPLYDKILSEYKGILEEIKKESF